MESACVGKTEQIVTLLALSHFEPGRAPTASMLAAVRPHCILHARDLRMLAFDFGLCRWSAFFGRSLVVYYRIAQISRLNLACAGVVKSKNICIREIKDHTNRCRLHKTKKQTHPVEPDAA
jgi:hypothetical protein